MTATTSAAPQQNPWHLDRINQRTLPLDSNSVLPPSNGAGIDIYVIDVKVRRTHEQFGGRALLGWDARSRTPQTPKDVFPVDCSGHGTHVSALAAGSSVGVARGANIIPVVTLDCAFGQGEIDDVIAGLEWIRRRHQSGRLAIANLSLGVELGSDGEKLNAAIRRLVADGVMVVVAAGNSDRGLPIDACRVAPPSEPQVLTVAASTQSDRLASYSYVGSCVDIIAPGGEVGAPLESAWSTADNAYAGSAGTSMSAPLVSGYAALLAGRQPTLCPSQIFDAVVSRATTEVIQGIDMNTPNRLLFLDASLVTSTVVPGAPTNITVSASNRALHATWDSPCDGGTAITGYNVQVSRAGVPVRTIAVPAGVTQVRVPRLVNGVTYMVTVNAVNAVGVGPWSTTAPLMKPVNIRRGTTYVATAVVKGDSNSKVALSVLPASVNVCSVKRAPLRIVARAAGVCRLSVLPRNALSRVIHRVRIS